MKRRYVRYALPYEAWKNFKAKQQKICETYTDITGKKKTIPLSKIILSGSKRPWFFEDNEVVELGKHRRKI